MPRYLILFFTFFSLVAQSQTVVCVAFGPFGRLLYQVDLATCTFCPIMPLPIGPITETLVFPNGNIAIASPSQVDIFTPPSTTPVATVPGLWSSAIIAPNGDIYMSNGLSLFTIDPITYASTLVGNFPPGINIYTIFTSGGTIYGIGDNGAGSVNTFQINLSPFSVISVQSVPQPFISTSTTTSTGQVIVSLAGAGVFPSVDFATYNPTTNSSTPICQNTLSGISGLSAVPPGVTYNCVCLPSSAGTPVSPSGSACAPLSFTAAFNPDFLLDPNDGVNYILFTNPSSPLTSILFQNSTGIFPFVPPLQVGINYYIARIVGDVTTGVVNLADPCIDVSPFIEVFWRPIPTLVSITATNTNLCNGQCQNVTIELQGTPPFAYGWQWQQNGNLIGNTQVVFNQSSNVITFQACAPPGVSGPLSVVLCGITDAFCFNQP